MPLRTSDIAKELGIHPNTVRLYEEIGFLPPVPRGANGYRLFTERHLDQVRLIRSTNRCSWLGGKIRDKAIGMLSSSANDDFNVALANAKALLALVQHERSKAELATVQLAEWAAGDAPSIATGGGMTIRQAAAYLDVTVHTLRNWDRNRLVQPGRQPSNGYRIYGPAELRRLMVIRALRRARFNTMSILWMFRQLDANDAIDLRAAINALPPGEDDVYYSTNRWLTKVCEVEQYAHETLEILESIIHQYAATGASQAKTISGTT